jgi:hypothetical protein
LTEERQDQGAEYIPPGIERRSGRERRKGVDAEFFSGGGIERRSGVEPRLAAGVADHDRPGSTVLRVRCGWCQSEMGEGHPVTVDAQLPAASQGICPACSQRVFGKRPHAVLPSDRG